MKRLAEEQNWTEEARMTYIDNLAFTHMFEPGLYGVDYLNNLQNKQEDVLNNPKKYFFNMMLYCFPSYEALSNEEDEFSQLFSSENDWIDECSKYIDERVGEAGAKEYFEQQFAK